MVIYNLTGDLAQYDKIKNMPIEIVYEWLEVALREQDVRKRIKISG